MVDTPKSETLREIAVRHGRAYNTLRNQWARHPDWPDPVGRRGQAYVYDQAAVDAVIAERFARTDTGLQSRRLYTARELEASGIGITAATIRADRSRGRWPAPDSTEGGTNRWTGATATKALAGRRRYQQSAPERS